MPGATARPTRPKEKPARRQSEAAWSPGKYAGKAVRRCSAFAPDARRGSRVSYNTRQSDSESDKQHGTADDTDDSDSDSGPRLALVGIEDYMDFIAERGPSRRRSYCPEMKRRAPSLSPMVPADLVTTRSRAHTAGGHASPQLAHILAFSVAASVAGIRRVERGPLDALARVHEDMGPEAWRRRKAGALLIKCCRRRVRAVRRRKVLLGRAAVQAQRRYRGRTGRRRAAVAAAARHAARRLAAARTLQGAARVWAAWRWVVKLQHEAKVARRLARREAKASAAVEMLGAGGPGVAIRKRTRWGVVHERVVRLTAGPLVGASLFLAAPDKEPKAKPGKAIPLAACGTAVQAGPTLMLEHGAAQKDGKKESVAWELESPLAADALCRLINRLAIAAQPERRSEQIIEKQKRRAKELPPRPAGGPGPSSPGQGPCKLAERVAASRRGRFRTESDADTDSVGSLAQGQGQAAGR